jgi:hypothetical protein
MPADITAIREWMDEGDRLLARAYEHLAAAGGDPAETEVASSYFAQAAQTYLAGAVEYQHGDHAIGATVPTTDELTSRLTDRFRAETIAARHASTHAESSAPSTQRSLARSQTFAEGLRDRFAHALPEAFHGGSAPVPQPMDLFSRSR